jgi:hypothetical protein
MIMLTNMYTHLQSNWGEITFLSKKNPQIFGKYFSYFFLAHFNISQYARGRRTLVLIKVILFVNCKFQQ